MIRQILCDGWKMRRIGDESFEGAVVPGSVYTDLLRNGKMEDPFFKDHEKQALDRMNDDYEYVFCLFLLHFSLDKCRSHVV